jgi:hypothetical protein
MPTNDRRLAARIPIERPCKVFRRGTQRYVSAITRDVSATGALLEVRSPRHIIPGERIDVGVAWSNSPIVLEDALMEAKVVRVIPLSDDRQVVGVAFENVVALGAVA